jgi:Ran GTPase-activating protein (RanGAP) involved in mRNA processing and transport
LSNAEKLHWIGEGFLLSALLILLKQCLVNYIAKELRKISLADNSAGRRISDILEDLCDQLTDQCRTSRFAL